MLISYSIGLFVKIPNDWEIAIIPHKFVDETPGTSYNVWRLHSLGLGIEITSLFHTFLNFTLHFVCFCPVQMYPCVQTFIIVFFYLFFNLFTQSKRLFRQAKIKKTVALFRQDATPTVIDKVCTVS